MLLLAVNGGRKQVWQITLNLANIYWVILPPEVVSVSASLLGYFTVMAGETYESILEESKVKLMQRRSPSTAECDNLKGLKK